MTPRRRILLVLALTLGTIGCDHATKRLAVDHLRGTPGHSYLGGMVQLRYAENQGGFLSLGASMDDNLRFFVFTVGVGILLLALLGMALWHRRMGTAEVLAMTALAAGGISNWIDRATNDGRVVDFLILQAGPLRTGVFNVADVVIMAAIPLLFFTGRRNLAGQQEAVEDPNSG